MKKIYVLDTNVLLHSTNALTSFEDNYVIIPDVCIDELDNHKRDKGEIGVNARTTARILDKMREDKDNGDLLNGYHLDTGGIIKVEMNHIDAKVPVSWRETPDLRILRVCVGILNDVKKGEFFDVAPSTPVILVSNDSYLRIKASLIGIKAEIFDTESAPDEDNIYNGRTTTYINPFDLNKVFSDSSIEEKSLYYFANDEDAYNYYIGENVTPLKREPLVENEYLIIKSMSGQGGFLARYRNGKISMLPDEFSERSVFGIKAKNAGQKFIFDALLRSPKECPLVIIKGPAGTRKTLLAIATGLHKVIDDETYRKILYLRGNTKLDEDIGFLPGTEEEKMEWALRPVKDNLEVILSSSNKLSKMIPDRRDDPDDVKYSFTPENILNENARYFFDQGYITIEPVAHMRGRSIAGTFVIIDEAQNLTPNQVKTLISRAGNDTKIVLMGDPYQIDHPYLDFRTNGLCYASDKLKSSKLVAQITLTEEECERSELSLEISRRMNKNS